MLITNLFAKFFALPVIELPYAQLFGEKKIFLGKFQLLEKENFH